MRWFSRDSPARGWWIHSV